MPVQGLQNENERLRCVLHLPRREAARMLGLSRRRFKALCLENGISRWPRQRRETRTPRERTGSVRASQRLRQNAGRVRDAMASSLGPLARLVAANCRRISSFPDAAVCAFFRKGWNSSPEMMRAVFAYGLATGTIRHGQWIPTTAAAAAEYARTVDVSQLHIETHGPIVSSEARGVAVALSALMVNRVVKESPDDLDSLPQLLTQISRTPPPTRFDPLPSDALFAEMCWRTSPTVFAQGCTVEDVIAWYIMGSLSDGEDSRVHVTASMFGLPSLRPRSPESVACVALLRTLREMHLHAAGFIDTVGVRRERSRRNYDEGTSVGCTGIGRLEDRTGVAGRQGVLGTLVDIAAGGGLMHVRNLSDAAWQCADRGDVQGVYALLGI